MALLQPGAVGELVLLPGEGQGGKGVRRAELYGGPNGTLTHEGRVCVVLGAGNQVRGLTGARCKRLRLVVQALQLTAAPHVTCAVRIPYSVVWGARECRCCEGQRKADGVRPRLLDAPVGCVLRCKAAASGQPVART